MSVQRIKQSLCLATGQLDLYHAPVSIECRRWKQKLNSRTLLSALTLYSNSSLGIRRGANVENVLGRGKAIIELALRGSRAWLRSSVSHRFLLMPDLAGSVVLSYSSREGF